MSNVEGIKNPSDFVLQFKCFYLHCATCISLEFNQGEVNDVHDKKNVVNLINEQSMNGHYFIKMLTIRYHNNAINNDPTLAVN